MKAILCLALIATCAFALDSHKQTVLLQTSSALEKVKENPMGALVMQLAQIHMATEGPIEDLVVALEDLVTWTGREVQLENQGFFMAGMWHDEAVQYWQANIDSANAAIAYLHSLLEGTLYPTKEGLEATIAQLQQALQQNIEVTAAETQQRAGDHATWVEKDAEFSTAIDACHEALALLNQLRNGEVSLAQVRVAQQSMKKVQEKVGKLKNNKHATLLKALASIAQNFADQGVVVQVIGLVENLLQNAEDGQFELASTEVNAERFWEQERLPGLQAEHDSLVAGIDANTAALDDVNNAIASAESDLESWESALTEFNNNLEAENNQWTITVSIHNFVIGQLDREFAGAQEAYNIVTSASFSKYLNRTINNI